VSERRAKLEKDDVLADPIVGSGKADTGGAVLSDDYAHPLHRGNHEASRQWFPSEREPRQARVALRAGPKCPAHRATRARPFAFALLLHRSRGPGKQRTAALLRSSRDERSRQ